MSSVTKTLPVIRRHPEAMYVRFADLPYEVSLEVASNFVVDFSPDNDVVGLEILWPDTDRAGSEPRLAGLWDVCVRGRVAGLSLQEVHG